MIDLDPCKLLPEVAALLMHRGSGLPPLDWSDRPIRMAKETLDSIDDEKLFGPGAKNHEEDVAAMRALLYLWTGHIDDCKMFAQGARSAERAYITGLCDRTLGDFAAAKEAFQMVEQHPIYDALTTYTLKSIKTSSGPLLIRLGDMLKMGAAWEPHAFTDLYAQVRAGKGDPPTEQMVCTIQCKEFELLFAYCYRRAVGEPVAQAHTTTPIKRRQRVTRPTKRVKASPSKPDSSPKTGKLNMSLRKDNVPRCGAYCPKCNEINIVPETLRGSPTLCTKCKTRFLVPKAAPAKSPATR